MKLIFKTETETIKEIELHDMTDAVIKELETAFDEKPILKYEITFKEGAVVKHCHGLQDISEDMVSTVTITLG